MDRTELIEILKEAFPECWWECGEDFDLKYDGGIWTGEGSYISVPVAGRYVELPAFDKDLWEDREGVASLIYKTIQMHGWKAKWHDLGTVILTKKNI